MLSVHLPLSEGTRWLLDGEAFASMRPGAIVVNTNRGGVIRSEHLAQALREEVVAGAGLDVFGDEVAERPVGTGFLELDNVVLTPHVASAAFETYTAMMDHAIEAIAAFREGGPPRGLLNLGYNRVGGQ